MPPLGLLATSIINGLEEGLLYALVAVGFSLIYSVGRMLFMTHAQIYMLGSLGALILIERIGIPFFPALFLIMLGTGLLGLLFERVLIRPFHDNELAVFILSLAGGIIIANVCLYVFGGQHYGVRTPFPGKIALWGTSFPIDRIAIGSIALAIVLFLNFFLNRVKAGQAIRAVAQDPEAAALQGIDKNRSMQIVLFLSLATAGGAGVLIAPLYWVDVLVGTPALMNTFIVVILGGMGSFVGAIVGGLFLGLIHSVGGIFIGGLTSLLSFVIVIIFLVVRPQGFFGRE